MSGGSPYVAATRGTRGRGGKLEPAPWDFSAIARILSERARLDERLENEVRRARAARISWRRIGAAIGMERSVAYRRWHYVEAELERRSEAEARARRRREVM